MDQETKELPDDPAHHAPVGVDDQTVTAVGKITEALETCEIVEDYDDGYWSVFRAIELRARDQLMDGRRHVYEARMKQRERSVGRLGHEATPDELA